MQVEKEDEKRRKEKGPFKSVQPEGTKVKSVPREVTHETLECVTLKVHLGNVSFT